ncbi:bifunctional phosphopantothenoylcysteine decarboxylase/phosphopantothenate--cysteine ligase CoaBC [Porphyromonas levii]|uniref:bifunctional phosphopantothenoylcysteine decarboxylase/phosphopantothenate--cysteine ligase CoaBC n=1 Tax=Porphyromonas levii TaxID=28114 RepID=UPI001BAE342C|nr:Cysteine/Cysteine sulfinic acid decarboxylase [Porphyromonas levii]
MKGKHIILGVTGSIAAYKSAILARQLVKAGAEVQVVMTPAAKEFITPLTLSTLTGCPVLSEFFNERSGAWNSHVDLGVWADAMVIAPATASTLGKMANGIADNLLITTYLSCRAPVFIAPAMDLDMFAHPSTTRSIHMLQDWGVTTIEPGVGELASHLVGKGRMAEPEEIVKALENFFKPQHEQTLSGVHMLITSGPTYEKIDPVRFIGNYSTGKMGKALAEAAAERGAIVRFITGPVSTLPESANIRITKVESAQEMYDACVAATEEYEVAIFCAAVADYRVATKEQQKIKRETRGAMSLDLVPNPDISAAMGERKQEGQWHIGFALETEVHEEAIRDKMERKKLDMIVVNSLQDKGAGFGVDTNKVTLYDDDGWHSQELSLMSKREVAEAILDRLEQLQAEE